MRNYASANTICQMLSEETANVFLEIFTQPFPRLWEHRTGTIQPNGWMGCNIPNCFMRGWPIRLKTDGGRSAASRHHEEVSKRQIMQLHETGKPAREIQRNTVSRIPHCAVVCGSSETRANPLKTVQHAVANPLITSRP